MKRVYIFGMLMLALTLMGENIQAQVIEACAGADSVKLRLDNFLYGSVQWQQSDDNIEWEDIDYATDTVYVFKPERTRYYRAIVYYKSCPFDTSQVTLVRVTAQANAGDDRIIESGFPTFLYANMEDDAWGEWTFLEGTGGVLSDPTDNMPVFTGTDTLYRLLWTLSNVCGSTSDTVEVQYVENEYYDAIVMVDTTDLIVSDTSEMEVGFYKIVFNTPVPNITDTTVLTGFNNGKGFLRKIFYHEYHGDTCWMVTKQATLDDILIRGVINFENFDAMNQRRLPSQGRFVRLNHFPTRAEINNDSLFERGKVVYYNPLAQKNNADKNWDFNYTLPNLTSPIRLSPNGEISLTDADISIRPHFYCTYDKMSLGVSPRFIFGCNEGWINAQFKLLLNSPSITVRFEKDFLKKCLFSYWRFYPPIDIDIFFKLPFNADITIYTSPIEFTFGLYASGINASLPFNVLIQTLSVIPNYPYRHLTVRDREGIFDISFPSLIDSHLQGSMYLGCGFEVVFYEGIMNIEPSVGLEFNTEFCGSNNFLYDEFELNGSLDLIFKCDFSFGGLLDVISEGLGFENTNLCIDKEFKFHLKNLLKGHTPNRIDMLSGNNQRYLSGSMLPSPICVKVPTFLSTFKSFPVYFLPINGGIVSQSHVFTNECGIAQTMWAPLNFDSKLLVSIFGCNQTILDQIVFNTTQDCYNNTLHICRKKVGQDQISVYASGGRPPYTYYLQDTPYTTPPIITPEPGVSYLFGVMDMEGCFESINYKAEPISCYNTTLNLTHSLLDVEGFSMPILSLYADGDAPPFTYMLDGDPNDVGAFQSSPLFYNISIGNHTAYVKDSLGCIRHCSFYCGPDDVIDMTVVTLDVQNITETSAQVVSVIEAEDLSYVQEKGVCFDIQPNPTVMHSRVVSNNSCNYCNYNCQLMNLIPGDRIYVRAYAINPIDTVYGNELSFTTLTPNLPTVVTSIPTNITYSTAEVGGEVTDVGGSPVTSRGVCWGTQINPSFGFSNSVTTGEGLGEFHTTLTTMVQGTQYYVRAFATNSSGTAYGDNYLFWLLNPSAPDVETDSVYNVTASSATASGRVTYSNGDSVHTRGFCWSLSTNPTLLDDVVVCGSDTGHFDAVISGLLPDTTYYLKAFAINNVDTGYGVIISFPTDTLAPDTLTPPDTTVTYGQPCDPPTLTDYDGNVYHAVQIGSQCWMQENLRTTHFADGNSIAMGHTGSSTTDAYRYAPENDMNKVPIYGYLYNWSALVHGSSGSNTNPSGLQGICPNGWHVPSNAEWNDLATCLGTNYPCGGDGQNIAKAMASTTTDWYTNNSNSCAVGNNTSLNNASGFTALPAGFFAGGSMPSETGPNAYFATSTAGSSFLNYFMTVRYITYSQSTLQSNQELKSSAFSVRCVRN